MIKTVKFKAVTLKEFDFLVNKYLVENPRLEVINAQYSETLDEIVVFFKIGYENK